MGNSELKRKIIGKLDSLDESQLIQLLTVLEELTPNNLQEPETDYQLEEWDLMPAWQRKRIEEAMESLDNGEGIPHEEVIASINKKFFSE